MGVQRIAIRRMTVVIGATLIAALVLAASASADLTVSQTASPKWATKGQPVTITVQVASTGPGVDPSDPMQVELFAVRPGGSAHVNNPYLSATPSHGTCRIHPAGAYHVADCDLGDLAPGARAQIVAVVRLNEPMDHIAAPAIATRQWSELNVAVSAPPIVTGPKQIRLTGLPKGCASRDFTLSIHAKVPRAKKIVTHIFLGFDRSGEGIDWRRSANGNRLKVRVPVSHIFDPSIGKIYTLQIYVQRRANTTLGVTVKFGLCQVPAVT